MYFFFKLNYVKCTIYFMKYKLYWAQGQENDVWMPEKGETLSLES